MFLVEENVLFMNDHSDLCNTCYYNIATGEIIPFSEGDEFPSGSESKDYILMPYKDHGDVRRAFFDRIEAPKDYDTLMKASRRSGFFRVINDLGYYGLYFDIQNDADEKKLIDWCEEHAIAYK